MRQGEAYLVAQGIEQSEEFNDNKDTQFVEVGASRTVAFKISPGDAVHLACDILLRAAPHLKICGGCNELVIQTAVDVGVLEEAGKAP